MISFYLQVLVAQVALRRNRRFIARWRMAFKLTVLHPIDILQVLTLTSLSAILFNIICDLIISYMMEMPLQLSNNLLGQKLSKVSVLRQMFLLVILLYKAAF